MTASSQETNGRESPFSIGPRGPKVIDRPIMFGFYGCFPLCQAQADLSEISGNTRGKWNDIFRLTGPGMAWSEYTIGNKWTTCSFPVRRNQNGSFTAFEFRPKFPESLAWWKAPKYTLHPSLCDKHSVTMKASQPARSACSGLKKA